MFTTMIYDLSGAAILTALFLVLIILTEIWTRLRNPEPELSRKIIHSGGGVISLLFPFLVHSAGTVLILAVLMSFLLLACAHWQILKSLGRVKRKSYGSEYFPLAIFLIFLLSAGNKASYVAAVLVLAGADAGAALVGSRFGKIRYSVDQELKSLEGSLAFLALAWVFIFFPLLLFSPLPLPICFFSASLIAMIACMVEAVSRQGRDNIFIPLAVALIMPKITAQPLAEIVYQNISLIAIFLILISAVWRSRSMNVGGCLTVTLFFYACWSLGSELWIIPLIGSFLLFLITWNIALKNGASSKILRVPVAAQSVTIPLLLLLLANFSGNYSLFLAPFVAAIMQHTLTFSLAHLNLQRNFRYSTQVKPIFCALLTWLLVSVPTWYLQNNQSEEMLWLQLVLIMASAIFIIYNKQEVLGLEIYNGNRPRIIKSFLAGLIILFLQLAGFTGWQHW